MMLVILSSLKTIESLQIGVATNFRVTPLLSMRTVPLTSLQSCHNVDADTWCKRVLKLSTNFSHCLFTCRFKYAGMRSSTMCHCGTGYNKFGESTSCNMCDSDTEGCGGTNKISIYDATNTTLVPGKSPFTQSVCVNPATTLQWH